MNSLPPSTPPSGGTALIEMLNLPTPRDKKSLIDTLGCVSFVTQITIAAMEVFKNLELRQYDALVGETACQLRAAKILDLADLYSHSTSWQEEIIQVQEEARKILQTIQTVKSDIEAIPLSQGRLLKEKYSNRHATEICENWKILQRLSPNIRFLVESYWLTQTKELIDKPGIFYQRFDQTTPKRLKSFNSSWDGQSVSSNMQLITEKKLQGLVLLVQRSLASSSVNYLQQEAKLLPPSSMNDQTREVLQNHILQDKMMRVCAPCFYSLETLLERMIDKNQSLLIDIGRWTPEGKRIGRTKILYAPDVTTRTFKQVSSLTGANLPEAVFVIIGNSIKEDQEQLSEEAFLQMFSSHPLEKILRANWAQHAQYPSMVKQEDIHLPTDERLDKLAKEAQLMGCTSGNMSLFVVNHILCDRLQDALNNQELL